MRGVVAVTALAGCTAEPARVELAFQASWGDTPFACGEQATGIGRSGSTVTPTFLSLFVHVVELRDRRGDWVAVALEPGPASSSEVALVDLADGRCAFASPETSTTLTGWAPGAAWDAVRFRVGVPEADNHLDLASAEPPLDDATMWWSWLYGYVYLRLDLALDSGEGWGFHLGATDCEGDPDAGFACAAGNVPSIEVEGIDPDAPVVNLDLARLLADVDLASSADGSPGCMSDPLDPDCAPLFSALGLPFDGVEPQVPSCFDGAAP